ncbi:NAD(P)H-binding protein [Virgibacillus sp. NKC19-3]|uniref:NAD(P)-dependent oxidoreductase n=1 Tax=Virgibacillus saliphilus TaxID=2831674 RepID=UPI001C9A6E96|nr:NAD(P)H-binding protein [Virgibacillus sp. NKC19-3]MBY7141971.1 NAD(P)H-binding protein [Virgibacillus sp. NKC19-3]
MKVVVFGATGNTGIELVKQLLLAGHEVTAIVRKPEKLALFGTQLIIVKGDVLKPSTLDGKMMGKDAVLSVLGGSHREPTTVYSEGMENIMNEMRKSGVRRLVCLSAETLKSKQAASMKERILLKVLWKIFYNIYSDMQRMEEKIYRSNLDWTIIRPPRLTNGDKTGDFQIAINQPISKGKGSISTVDLSTCMALQLTNPASIHHVVYVSRT